MDSLEVSPNTFSGLGYHPRTGAIIMPEDWWEDKLKVHPVAKVFKQTRLEREEDLDIIFANMEPVNVGPPEDGGHERGRAGVPTHYVDSDDSDDSETDLHMHNSNPPPPQPTRRTERVSLSIGKRKASDPIDSRASFLEGFKTFYMMSLIGGKKSKHHVLPRRLRRMPSMRNS